MRAETVMRYPAACADAAQEAAQTAVVRLELVVGRVQPVPPVQLAEQPDTQPDAPTASLGRPETPHG